jgi:hypothetical protein
VVGRLYYVTVDSVLFDTDAGARRLYNQLETVRHGLTEGGGRKDWGTNRAAGSSCPRKTTSGTIGTSDVVRIYHRFVFRRGISW